MFTLFGNFSPMRTCSLVFTLCGIVLSFGCLLSAGIAFAETLPAQNWSREWNGPTNHSDNPSAVLTLPDRSVLVAGSSYDPNGVGHRPVLIRYSPAGTVMWSQIEPTFSQFRSLAKSSTGDVLLRSILWVGTDLFAFVRRVRPADGTTVWEAKVAVSQPSPPFEPAMTEDPATGTLLVAAMRDDDFLAVRIALEDGRVLDEQTFDGPTHGVDRATSIAPLPNGGYVIAGPQGGTSNGYLVIAVDAKGGIMWTDQEKGPIGNVFTPAWVGVDQKGDVLVGGGPETTCGLFQFRAWKISAAGDRVWTVSWPDLPCSSAEPAGFDLAPDGSMALIGQSHNPFNMAILHVAPDGQFWSRVWNGPAGGNDDGVVIASDPFGNMIAGGYTAVIGGRDMAIVAWKPNGDQLFSRVDSVGPSATESVVGLSLGKNGTYSIVGAGFGGPQNNNIYSGLYQRNLLQGDVNNSGAVNVHDLLTIISAWGPCAPASPCLADIAPWPTGDDTVDVNDLLAVIANWG